MPAPQFVHTNVRVKDAVVGSSILLPEIIHFIAGSLYFFVHILSSLSLKVLLTF
jgi:hypothetical protein